VRRLRTPGVLTAVAAAVGLAVVATWLAVRPRARPPLVVRVAGRSVRLAPGTTLGDLVALLDLRPRAGSLLDVEADVLRANAFPGRLLLDGRPAAAGTRLRSGERVTLVAGRDRRERLSRQVVRVPRGVPSDPQFFLARTPGSEEIVTGALSHKLVSATFRPGRDAPRVERAVALSFDDGPSPLSTPRVLATLRRLHVPATFFVIGYLAEEYPGLVRREERAGMTVGNHSYNHPEVPPFDQLPASLVRDEIALGQRAIAKAGLRARLFRPPGGSVSPGVVRAARRLGERVVLWSVDPGDWRGIGAKQIVRAVLAAVRPGSIVLLHDGGGDRSATVAALPAIVKGIRRRGLRLVAVPPV
jgi:peptidoglycan-N-acetylglucosamine deacetylase